MNGKSQIQWWVGTHTWPLRPNRYFNRSDAAHTPPRPANDFPMVLITTTSHLQFLLINRDPYPASQTLWPRWLSGMPFLGRCFPHHYPNTKLPSPSPQKREQSSDACFQSRLSQWTSGLYLSETIEFNYCFSPAHKIVETMWGVVVTLDINVNSWKFFASSM